MNHSGHSSICPQYKQLVLPAAPDTEPGIPSEAAPITETIAARN
jgi:hypothetical protein